MTSEGRTGDFSAALGHTIRVIRTDQGLSRGDLARNAGISYSYLSAIENGTKPPSTKIQMLIARALGVRLHELLAAAEARAGRDDDPRLDELDEMLDHETERRIARDQARFLGGGYVPGPRPGLRRRGAASTDLGALTEFRQLLPRLRDEHVELVLDVARRLAASE